MAENEPEGDLSQTLERILGLFIRRRWVIAGTASTIALLTVLVSLYLPNRYTSEATIFVVQQRIPERYVVSASTSDVNQALEAMVQEVLSRPRLLAIIDELGLYQEQKTRVTPEELIEIARGDILVDPVKNRGNTFGISFIADTPHLAQQVTSRLTTLFIEQNLKTRADQATTTTNFLREQLDLAKNKLTEQEQRLRDYKMQHLGELPEQQPGNVGILASLQTQIDNVMSSRNQAQQQQIYLESLLSEYAQRDLIRLQSERKTLLTVYTLQHPAVLKKDQEIKAKQTFIERLRTAKAMPGRHGQPPEVLPDAEDNIGAAQLRSQLHANTLEIDNLNKTEQKLRADIDRYRNRLSLAPVREQELSSMQRDYELLRLSYGDLLKKEQESQLATNLEKRQEGQQFRLDEPANLPTRPSSPKRLKINLAGLAGGLLLGCVLAFLADSRDSSFRAESDVSGRLAIPLLVGIPLFFTPAEQRTRSRMKALEWVAGSVVVLAVLAAEFYVFRHG